MQFKIGSSSVSSSGGSSTAGKGCMTVFFAVFALIGAIATMAMVAETVREAQVWFWPEHPCTVVEATVVETGDDSAPYRPSVRFVYSIDGVEYESERVTRATVETSSYDEARGPSDRTPAGSQATCRVNPDRPDEAVLERRFPWIGFVALLPLIFVAVGAGGLYFVWRRPKAAPEESASISQRAVTAVDGRKIGLVVGLIFTAVGGALSVFLLIVPLARVIDALDWVETPAMVVGSTVRSWSTDDGMSYHTDILYEYTAGGRTWRSNRLDFFPGSSGDGADHREMVDRHPVGSETTCWVDPDDPGRSVLHPRPGLVFLIGLFPLVFLLVGLAVVALSIRSGKKPATYSRSAAAPGLTVDEREHRENLTLEPEAGPWAKVVGMTIFAAIWNGIIGVFVWQVVEGFRTGSPEWFLTVFMIPFVLVGLALIGGIFYTILAAFNPRPTLTVSPGSPRLGETLRVDWSFSGRAARIDRLEIVLEGHEKATYRRGTDTHTDRVAFASIELLSTDNEWEIGRGSASAAIPEDTMHSWTGDHNAVVWSLVFHGDIPRWPDVIETYEIEIRPLDRGRLLP